MTSVDVELWTTTAKLADDRIRWYDSAISVVAVLQAPWLPEWVAPGQVRAGCCVVMQRRIGSDDVCDEPDAGGLCTTIASFRHWPMRASRRGVGTATRRNSSSPTTASFRRTSATTYDEEEALARSDGRLQLISQRRRRQGEQLQELVLPPEQRHCRRACCCLGNHICYI
jgi:hypothetical protein